MKDQISANEIECKELRAKKKYLESINKDTNYQKDLQFSIEAE